MANSNDELANLCLDHAWRDEIDDDTRWLLEQAARRINRLGRRCLRLSHKLEALEARRDTQPASCVSTAAFVGVCVLASLYTWWSDFVDAVRRQFSLFINNVRRM